jgi:hypothetical protein
MAANKVETERSKRQRVSKLVHKCPTCRRRVKRPPFISLKDKVTRREVRYHSGGCLPAAAAEAERRGPEEIVLAFVHTRECGDAKGRLGCKGKCFAVELVEERGVSSWG